MARPADPNARTALLAATRRELVRAGLRGAHVEAITQACGLSKGAFYLHFESKEAAVRELVNGLMQQVDLLHGARVEAMARRFGSPRQLARLRARLRDPAQRAAISAEEAAFDRQILELMWEWRDLVDVLLRGSQGTEFEGALWNVVDRELERVSTILEFMRAVGLLRSDLPPVVTSSMVVGTWVVLVRQLAKLDERPDFTLWVGALQRLIGGGLAPLPDQPAKRRATAPARARRRGAAKRRTTRRGVRR